MEHGQRVEREKIGKLKTTSEQAKKSQTDKVGHRSKWWLIETIMKKVKQPMMKKGKQTIMKKVESMVWTTRTITISNIQYQFQEKSVVSL